MMMIMIMEMMINDNNDHHCGDKYLIVNKINIKNDPTK